MHALDHYIGSSLALHGFASEFPRETAERLPQFRRLVETMKRRTLTPRQVRKALEDEVRKAKEAFVEDVVRMSAKYAPDDAQRSALRVAAMTLADELCETGNSDLSASAAFHPVLSGLETAAAAAGYKTGKAYWTSRIRLRMKPCLDAAKTAARPDGMLPILTVETDFLHDAHRLDNAHTSRGNKGYWASDVELLARAGAAWMKDRLAGQGIRDDYLCGHADGVSMDGDGIIHMSPQGDERTAINAAFDDLIEEIKLRGLLGRRMQPAAILDKNGVLSLCCAPWPVTSGEKVRFTDDGGCVHEGTSYPFPESGQEPDWLSQADSIAYVDVSADMDIRSMRGWFEGCGNLVHADLRGVPAGCDLSYTFRGCGSLSSVGLPPRTDIRQFAHEGMLEGCTRLVEADEGLGRVPEDAKCPGRRAQPESAIGRKARR